MLASVIIGGGPGGLGPLLAAAKQGQLGEWLDGGVAVVDRRLALGGTLGRYIINSDTLGGAYLECLEGANVPESLKRLYDHPLVAEMEAHRFGFPPLRLVHRYMHLLGAEVEALLRASRHGAFYGRTEVTALHLQDDGTLRAELTDHAGNSRSLRARTAVVALGGMQHPGPHHLKSGLWLADCKIRHSMSSDDLMTSDGLERAEQVLSAQPGRSIVILGGSHSGYSAASMLIQFLSPAALAANGIVLLQRRQPPIFYPTAEEALADGYTARSGDICAKTKRVNRLGGLRGDGREMWRRINGRPGATHEHRIVCHDLSECRSNKLRSILEEAALVVTALGYRAATLPIFDAAGDAMQLQANHGGPAVDDDCRLVLRQGRPIPGVFGLGLGSGFRPTGTMGGEPNFKGQANSLWLYQNDIGAMIYKGIKSIVGESAERSSKALAGRAHRGTLSGRGAADPKRRVA